MAKSAPVDIATEESDGPASFGDVVKEKVDNLVRNPFKALWNRLTEPGIGGLLKGVLTMGVGTLAVMGVMGAWMGTGGGGGLAVNHVVLKTAEEGFVAGLSKAATFMMTGTGAATVLTGGTALGFMMNRRNKGMNADEAQALADKYAAIRREGTQPGKEPVIPKSVSEHPLHDKDIDGPSSNILPPSTPPRDNRGSVMGR